MRSGELDKSIAIQTNTPVQDAFGEPIDSWATTVTVAAKVMPTRGGERFTAQQYVGRTVVTFKIRWRTTPPTVKNRIVYDGRTYDITDVRELGRREGLEIDATARSE